MLLHIDGDSFFASIEQSIKPYLKGKPVVTGKERNIIAAASIEAKKRGISRGMTLWDAKKMVPDLVVLPTDYETVSLFSKRMHDIIRRYTPIVEEYGVDEAFADITGLRRYHHTSYEGIAAAMQQDIHVELGITVTMGIALTKTLCKIAVDKGKPAGLVSISRSHIDEALSDVNVEDIWNIGPATAALLHKYGMHTALQFKQKPEEYIKKLLTKPGMQTWHELNGIQAIPFEEEKISYKSIGKSKTFTPPSNNKEFVFAQLVKNIENACMKARRYHQGTRNIVIYVRTKEFRSIGMEGTVERVTAYPNELICAMREMFEHIWKPGYYRATGVFLPNLQPLNPMQPTLFENPAKLIRYTKLYGAIDTLREHYGKHAVHLGASLHAQKNQHISSRGDVPVRRQMLIKGETKRKRLPIPMLQVKLR